jgi:hypothetical protein
VRGRAAAPSPSLQKIEKRKTKKCLLLLSILHNSLSQKPKTKNPQKEIENASNRKPPKKNSPP